MITWAEPKRRSDLRKHGLDFADAEHVFEGVTYNDHIQLISMRKATRREREIHDESIAN